MNASSAGVWFIPPPPGTENEASMSPDMPTWGSSWSSKRRHDQARIIDRIDPYLRSPDYVEFERTRTKYRGRSRSRSYERSHRRRRSRSRSKHRHRRSRSRSKHRRRRSRSRSLSKHARSGYRRHKRSRHSRSGSRSRSKSQSKSENRLRKSHKSSRSKRNSESESDVKDVNTEVVDMKIEEEEEECESEEPAKENAFKNDGSFLEMFKKLQEEQEQQKAIAVKAEQEAKLQLPTFAKRRGGRVLKTGLVQKTKQSETEAELGSDAWSVYMKEVKRYKEACCDDDSKTRPLVK